ncbi:MAG: hypothetical protein ABJJ44_18080 [Paraglaciecola sp.]|uniref:hypothetical protein n=1 Tax=Paraglaciecola sp. TaxID=1920173 RepID=UPI003296AEEC
MDKLQAVILGGILGFVLSIIKDYFFANKKQKTERYYLAIIVSASLESFISKCLDVVCDDGEYGERGCLETRVSTPRFEPMELDVSWQSLDKGLLYNILTLPEKISDANAHISAAAEYAASPPDYEEFFDTRKLKYSELGLIACSIVTKLQTTAKLPKPDLKEWSPEKVFSEQKEKALKAIRATEKRNRETNEKLFGTTEKNA